MCAHALNSFLERNEILVDRLAKDLDLGDEVAVGQVVAHAGDLAPRDLRLSIQHLVAEELDRLTYL